MEFRYQDLDIDIWTRPVEPVCNGNYSYAVAFVSRRSDGTPTPYKISVKHLGLEHHAGYTVKVKNYKMISLLLLLYFCFLF